MTGTLYYGDNLDILRTWIKDESIDLIYLDPPFNSKKDYNVLFKEHSGELSESQIRAFEDSWKWDKMAQETYEYLINSSHVSANVSGSIRAMVDFLRKNDLSAYLVMMTVRLIELRRVLKPTGSIYLHCDPTASHYLKVIMDTIFGPGNFRNEIIWKKTNSPKFQSDEFGNQHDIIFFYSKTKGQNSFNKIYREPDADYLKSFRYDDQDGRGPYQTIALSNKTPLGGFGKMKEWEWRGIKSRWIYSKETMDRWYTEGKIIKTKLGYRKKYYLSESPGQIVSDIWVDNEVAPLQGLAKEKLGYPTQKPEALLERIIQASSNKGDIVLDPFCGCGTTIHAAQKLERNWIGIDITHLAINLIKNRLFDAFRIVPEIVGEPKDLEGARQLALLDRYQFQWWALSLIGARPFNDERKKGADRGIDGIIYSPVKGSEKVYKGIVQVKSGHVDVKHIRDLIGTMEREKADYGIYLTLEEPTGPMNKEAIEAGHFKDVFGQDVPKIQIFTIEDLLNGKKPIYPVPPDNFRTAEREKIVRSNGKDAKILDFDKEKND